MATECWYWSFGGARRSHCELIYESINTKIRFQFRAHAVKYFAFKFSSGWAGRANLLHYFLKKIGSYMEMRPIALPLETLSDLAANKSRFATHLHLHWPMSLCGDFVAEKSTRINYTRILDVRLIWSQLTNARLIFRDSARYVVRIDRHNRTVITISLRKWSLTNRGRCQTFVQSTQYSWIIK